MARLESPLAAMPRRPLDPAALAGRVATLRADADRIADRPLTAAQQELAGRIVLDATEGRTAPWAPWERYDALPGGEPDAAATAIAEAVGHAAAASQLASLDPLHLAHAELHLAWAVKLLRTAGGAARGSRQGAAAAAWWAPWQRHYRGLMTAGLSQRSARHGTYQAMVAAGATLPTTGELPDDRSLRRWLG